MCVGEGSVFLHSHLIVAQHFRFHSEPIYQPDFQIHRSGTGSACYGEEVTQQDREKRSVADLAPSQCRTGRLGWFYYPNQAMKLQFS